MCENDLGAVCSCTVGFIYSQHSLPSLLLVLVFWSVAVFFFVCLYALGTVHYRWVGTHLTQLWFPPLLQFIHCTVPSFWLNMLCSWYFSKFWQPWVKLSKKVLNGEPHIRAPESITVPVKSGAYPEYMDLKFFKAGKRSLKVNTPPFQAYTRDKQKQNLNDL